MAATREELAFELQMLMATDRRLFASEERRRQWLLRELEQADTSAGVEETRALLRRLDERWETL